MALVAIAFCHFFTDFSKEGDHLVGLNSKYKKSSFMTSLGHVLMCGSGGLNRNDASPSEKKEVDTF